MSLEDIPEAPLPMPQLIWHTLYGRGLRSREELESLFSPRLKDLTHPLNLDGMDKAVARLCQAYEKNESICIYADFDLDGTPGLALLKRGLELLGYSKLSHFQPRRLVEGYGLHTHVIHKLHEQGINLVVTVDVGITAVDAVKEAQRLGIDVIITDHHLPGPELPRAAAVINPNKGNCNSGLGHLCGAGVAFYLFLALKQEFSRRGWLKNEVDPKVLLDCFVIGTLTDLVPLIKENRALVKHGLVELARTQRPGLRALLQALGMWGRPLSSSDVAIRFAPKLNALSRMETGVLPIDLFLVEDELQAEQMVAEVMTNNGRRVEFQSQAEQQAIEWVEKNEPKPYIWVWSDQFHQGVVGLVATRLAQRFNVPTFVGSHNTATGTITGSARVPGAGAINLLSALEAASLHLNRFGGHAPAAGFELDFAKAPEFDAALADFFKQDQPLERSFASVTYDAQGECEDFNDNFMKWYEAMGPFGRQFEQPIYMVKGLRVQTSRWLKGQHLKLTVSGRKGERRMEALWFSPPPEHPVLTHLEAGMLVDALVEPQWNHYQGQKSLQFLIKDLKKA